VFDHATKLVCPLLRSRLHVAGIFEQTSLDPETCYRRLDGVQAYCCVWVHLASHGHDVAAGYRAGRAALRAMTARIRPQRTPNLPLGKVTMYPSHSVLMPQDAGPLVAPKTSVFTYAALS
jgi:hypothetical protein